MDVTGVRVLVSGGTSGLGRAMAAALVEGGAHVVVTGRDSERATAAAAELGRMHAGRAVGIAMDVRDERSVADGVVAACDALGGIDVLVNNAGIGMRTVNPRFLTDPLPFWTVEPDGFRELFETNVVGYFLLARAVAPLMIEAGTGKIINVSVSESTTPPRRRHPVRPVAGRDGFALARDGRRPRGHRRHGEPARTGGTDRDGHGARRGRP